MKGRDSRPTFKCCDDSHNLTSFLKSANLPCDRRTSQAQIGDPGSPNSEQPGRLVQYCQSAPAQEKCHALPQQYLRRTPMAPTQERFHWRESGAGFFPCLYSTRLAKKMISSSASSLCYSMSVCAGGMSPPLVIKGMRFHLPARGCPQGIGTVHKRTPFLDFSIFSPLHIFFRHFFIQNWSLRP
jgi:hypothetical protein